MFFSQTLCTVKLLDKHPSVEWNIRSVKFTSSSQQCIFIPQLGSVPYRFLFMTHALHLGNKHGIVHPM